MDDLNFDVDLTTPLDSCLVNDFMPQQLVLNHQHSVSSNNNISPAQNNVNTSHIHGQQQHLVNLPQQIKQQHQAQQHSSHINIASSNPQMQQKQHLQSQTSQSNIRIAPTQQQHHQQSSQQHQNSSPGLGNSNPGAGHSQLQQQQHSHQYQQQLQHQQLQQQLQHQQKQGQIIVTTTSGNQIQAGQVGGNAARIQLNSQQFSSNSTTTGGNQPAYIIKNTNGQLQIVATTTAQGAQNSTASTQNTLTNNTTTNGTTNSTNSTSLSPHQINLLRQQQLQQQQQHQQQTLQHQQQHPQANTNNIQQVQVGSNQTIVRFPAMQQQQLQHHQQQQQQQQQQQNLVLITNQANSNQNIPNQNIIVKSQQNSGSFSNNSANQSPQNASNIINPRSVEKPASNSSTNLNRTLTPTPPNSNNPNLQSQTPPTTSSMNANSATSIAPNPQRVNPTATGGSGTSAQPGATPPTPMDLLKYLRNFLHTLMNLASTSVPDKYPLVRTLIQDLLDDRIDPETFIKKIQIEKNPPSPSLVPFLKKAMAQWRLVNGNKSIPIERFLEMAQGGQTTSGQPQSQPQPQQATQQPVGQPATVTQHPVGQGQMRQQQQGSSSSTPIVITSTNQQPNTVVSQSPSSLFIVNRPTTQQQTALTQQHHTQQQQQQIQGQIRPLIQQSPQSQIRPVIQQHQQHHQHINQPQQTQQQQQNIVTLPTQQSQTVMTVVQQQQLQQLQLQKQQMLQQQQQQQQQQFQQQKQAQMQQAQQHPQQHQLQHQKLQQQQQTPSYQSNISATIAKVSSTSVYSVQSPQQAQQQPSTSSSPSSSAQTTTAKLTNYNLPSTSASGSSSAASPHNISSPMKTESVQYNQQYLTQQQHSHVFQKPTSPANTKTIAKLIKTEDTTTPSSPASPNLSQQSTLNTTPATTKPAPSEYDSELNEVISMVGIDLAAEKKLLSASSTAATGTNKMTNLDQIRACKDEKFLNIVILHKKFVDCAKKHKLEDVSTDVATLVSHATQEYLRNIIEKLNVVTQHRLDMSMRTNDSYEMTNDVKSQIRFIEELDKIEKKKKDEAEREKLMKAAKSRSKGEDVELSKLKQKAKEVIQAESDELRRQDANKTALAAIGPRKKRKIEDSSGGASLTHTRTIFRPKIKRVSLRDLIFVLEQDKDFKKSPLLYKAINK